MNQQEYKDLMSKHRCQNLIVNVTNDCNLRCKYCFTQQNPQTMSFETMKKTINWLIKNNPEVPRYFINWFGGEPLLMFEQTIKPTMLWVEKEQLPIDWGITTNCVLLTPARLRFFEHFKTNILCSIDGDREVQDEQRPLCGGGSSFDSIEKIIPELVAYKGNTTFRSTVTPYNCHRLTEGYLYARRKGFRTYFAGMDASDLNWGEEEIERLAVEAMLIANTMYNDISNDVVPLHFAPLFSTIRNIFKLEPREFTPMRCGLGVGSLGVTPKGELTGCQEHSTYSGEDDVFFIGDIETGINAEKHMNLLNSYIDAREHLYTERTECQNCILKKECFEDSCPSLSWNLSKNFATPPYIYCRWRFILNRVAIWFLEKAAAEENTKVLEYIELHVAGNQKRSRGVMR